MLQHWARGRGRKAPMASYAGMNYGHYSNFLVETRLVFLSYSLTMCCAITHPNVNQLFLSCKKSTAAPDFLVNYAPVSYPIILLLCNLTIKASGKIICSQRCFPVKLCPMPQWELEVPAASRRSCDTCSLQATPVSLPALKVKF